MLLHPATVAFSTAPLHDASDRMRAAGAVILAPRIRLQRQEINQRINVNRAATDSPRTLIISGTQAYIVRVLRELGPYAADVSNADGSGITYPLGKIYRLHSLCAVF